MRYDRSPSILTLLFPLALFLFMHGCALRAKPVPPSYLPCRMPAPSGRPWKIKVRRMGEELFEGMAAIRIADDAYIFTVLEPGGMTLLDGAVSMEDGRLTRYSGMQQVTGTPLPGIIGDALFSIYSSCDDARETVLSDRGAWMRSFYALGIFEVKTITFLSGSLDGECSAVEVDNPWYSVDIIFERLD